MKKNSISLTLKAIIIVVAAPAISILAAHWLLLISRYIPLPSTDSSTDNSFLLSVTSALLSGFITITGIFMTLEHQRRIHLEETILLVRPAVLLANHGSSWIGSVLSVGIGTTAPNPQKNIEIECGRGAIESTAYCYIAFSNCGQSSCVRPFVYISTEDGNAYLNQVNTSIVSGNTASLEFTVKARHKGFDVEFPRGWCDSTKPLTTLALEIGYFDILGNCYLHEKVQCVIKFSCPIDNQPIFTFFHFEIRDFGTPKLQKKVPQFLNNIR